MTKIPNSFFKSIFFLSVFLKYSKTITLFKYKKQPVEKMRNLFIRFSNQNIIIWPSRQNLIRKSSKMFFCSEKWAVASSLSTTMHVTTIPLITVLLQPKIPRNENVKSTFFFINEKWRSIEMFFQEKIGRKVLPNIFLHPNVTFS